MSVHFQNLTRDQFSALVQAYEEAQHHKIPTNTFLQMEWTKYQQWYPRENDEFDHLKKFLSILEFPPIAIAVDNTQEVEDPTITHSMVMPFLDGSESYVLGFELGKIWSMLENKIYPQDCMLHAKSLPQLRMVAKHFRCDLHVDETTDVDWVQVTIVPSVPVPLRTV